MNAEAVTDRSPASLYPDVAKVGGLQRQGVEGTAIVDLLQTLDNAVSEVLRLFRRVKNMPKKDKIPEFAIWQIKIENLIC